MKLSSLAYIEGFYKRPRLDKEILKKYKEGIIIGTACRNGIIPAFVADNKLKKAEELISFFKKGFTD